MFRSFGNAQVLNIEGEGQTLVANDSAQKTKKAETSMSIAEILDNSKLMLDDSDSAVKLSVARDPNLSLGKDFELENPLSMHNITNEEDLSINFGDVPDGMMTDRKRKKKTQKNMIVYHSKQGATDIEGQILMPSYCVNVSQG